MSNDQLSINNMADFLIESINAITHLMITECKCLRFWGLYDIIKRSCQSKNILSFRKFKAVNFIL